MKKFIISALLLAALSPFATAQDMKLPAPSPSAVIKQDFSTSQIEISYSRPAMRDRTIFGDLVPYGKVWRTGANSATKITFGEDVSLNGKALKAGTYALYTVPGETKWKVMLNTGTSNWGVSGFDAKDDVLEFEVPVTKTEKAVQSFTISVANLSPTSCDIILAWEHTQVNIPVTADNDQRITDYLETAINQPKLPYAQAASYYLETGKHLDKALLYADKAIEENPNAFWMYWTKARIYQAQGKKTEAIAAGEKCVQLSSQTPYAAEYKNHVDKLKTAMK